MRVLVAVESCHRDRGLQQAQRDTWLKDLIVTDHKFFLGKPDTVGRREDEVFLDVDDSYKALPYKTQAICRWALAQEFDFMFKCDVDTLVNPWQFVFSGFQNHDYFGGENEDDSPYGRIQFASGGAGYFLSKKALTILSNFGSISTTAEDVWVSYVLRESGIRPVFHQNCLWRPGATVDKDTITLHLSSALQRKYIPEMMYEAYEKVKGLQ